MERQKSCRLQTPGLPEKAESDMLWGLSWGGGDCCPSGCDPQLRPLTLRRWASRLDPSLIDLQCPSVLLVTWITQDWCSELTWSREASAKTYEMNHFNKVWNAFQADSRVLWSLMITFLSREGGCLSRGDDLAPSPATNTFFLFFLCGSSNKP